MFGKKKKKKKKRIFRNNSFGNVKSNYLNGLLVLNNWALDSG